MKNFFYIIFALVLSSCASTPIENIKIRHYDKYSSNQMISVKCSPMSKGEIIQWSRSKSITCQRKTLYIACDYPGCKNELSPCLSGDNYEFLCKIYGHHFPQINYAEVTEKPLD